VKTVSHGCAFPYNHPERPDWAQARARPYLPAVQLPAPSPSSSCSAPNEQSPLIVWRSRWPYNYMELFSRILAAAPVLLSHSDAELIVPGLPVTAPSFYSDLLTPLCHRLHAGSRADSQRWLSGRRFSSGQLCCMNAAYAFNTSAVDALVAKILAHHRIPRRPPPAWAPFIVCNNVTASRDGLQRCLPPAPASALFEDARYALVFRLVTSRANLTASSRSITNAESVLAECEAATLAAVSSASRCQRIRFPPEMPFAAALRQLQTTTVLIGVHGAGLMNAIFMPRGSVLVEVFPSAFVHDSFGPPKYAFLGASLGFGHVQMVAPETSRHCVERAHAQLELLRDCDVTLEWASVEGALRPAPPSDTHQRQPATSTSPRPATAASSRRPVLTQHGKPLRPLLPARSAAAPGHMESTLHGGAPGGARDGWRCTVWPAGPETGDDKARCQFGNGLDDGFEYAHNAGRGTRAAVCGESARCTCCRRTGH